jgi:hypothetical protein
MPYVVCQLSAASAAASRAHQHLGRRRGRAAAAKHGARRGRGRERREGRAGPPPRRIRRGPSHHGTLLSLWGHPGAAPIPATATADRCRPAVRASALEQRRRVAVGVDRYLGQQRDRGRRLARRLLLRLLCHLLAFARLIVQPSAAGARRRCLRCTSRLLRRRRRGARLAAGLFWRRRTLRRAGRCLGPRHRLAALGGLSGRRLAGGRIVSCDDRAPPAAVRDQLGKDTRARVPVRQHAPIDAADVVAQVLRLLPHRLLRVRDLRDGRLGSAVGAVRRWIHGGCESQRGLGTLAPLARAHCLWVVGTREGSAKEGGEAAFGRPTRTADSCHTRAHRDKSKWARKTPNPGMPRAR